MSKHLLIIALAAIASASVGFAVAGDRSDLPQNAVWAAIGLLQQQIENIELSSKAARENGAEKDDISREKKELYLADAGGQNLGQLIYADVYSSAHIYRTYLSGLGIIAEFRWTPASGKVVVAGDSPMAFEEAECRGEAYLSNQSFPATNRLYRLNGEALRYFKLQEAAAKTSFSMLSLSDGEQCRSIGQPRTEEGFKLTEIFLPFHEPVKPPL